MKFLLHIVNRFFNLYIHIYAYLFYLFLHFKLYKLYFFYFTNVIFKQTKSHLVEMLNKAIIIIIIIIEKRGEGNCLRVVANSQVFFPQ